MNTQDFMAVYEAMVKQAMYKTNMPMEDLEYQQRRCFAFWLADNYNADMTRKDTAECILAGNFPKLTCQSDLQEELHQTFDNMDNEDDINEWFQNMAQHINEYFGD